MNFVKMEATGNDFIIVEGKRRWGRLAGRLCDRRRGIGADGLIALYPSRKGDIKARFFNADGSEAEACGNGLRCVARYLYEKKGFRKKTLLIETASGIKRAILIRRGGRVKGVRVNMGRGEVEGEIVLRVGGMELNLTKVSVGNPHAVLITEKPPEDFPLKEIGPLVENHPSFPNRTNFEVARLGDGFISMRVWERGVGETPSCGTGACAVALAMRKKGLIGERAVINLPGGRLTVHLDDEIWLEGSCEKIFEGEI